MTTREVTRENMLHGLMENGKIDKIFNCYPDFNSLLATCRRNPIKDEYKLCIDMFPTLMEHFQENGHIEDEFFEKLGFPMDEDTDGSFVRRDTTINQETRQRTKCLTYHHQASLREERIAIIENEDRRKPADNQLKLQNLIKDHI